MISDLYWISTITYAVVLILILYNDYKAKKNPSEVEKAFRVMTLWVIFFCVQDTAWGLCENGRIPTDEAFFAASTLFHVSTVLTTFFWLAFVLYFLGEKVKHKRLYLYIDRVIILMEILLAVANIFTPTLFIIKDGLYYAGPLRALTFVNQYVIYFGMGVVALFFAIKEKGEDRNKFFAVFVFALAPIIMGVCQLLIIEAPFYSLGYFLGCFLVHISIVAKERENVVKSSVLKSIADTYYSMHLIDLRHNTYEKFIETDLIKEYIGSEENPQRILDLVAKKEACEEHLPLVSLFFNLSDLNERMDDKKMISCEFRGNTFGWTRLSFVSVEKKNGKQSKVMLTSQIIDTERKTQMDLIFKSNNDELTGLLNRRAYEDYVNELAGLRNLSNLIIVSMDLNGLKVANDTLGHEAGDELLTGAAWCMKKCFSTYGHIYRTGGDEFCAFLNASAEQLEVIKRDFDEIVLNWRGEKIQELSISSGFVVADDEDEASIQKLITMADQRMYAAKAKYYQQKGIDRRGQRNAHSALCALYTKILKINITDDSYQIINLDENKLKNREELNPKISGWLKEFAMNGNVHPDDISKYLEKTDLDYMKNHFKNKNESLCIIYRRKENDAFLNYVMEIIPADDYEDSNQNLYLYVKKIVE